MVSKTTVGKNEVFCRVIPFSKRKEIERRDLEDSMCCREGISVQVMDWLWQLPDSGDHGY